MAFWDDVGDFLEDAADVALEVIDVAGDIAQVAGPVLTVVNPGIGMAVTQFGQYEAMADPYLEKVQSGLNDDKSKSAPAPQGGVAKGEVSKAAAKEFLENFSANSGSEITGKESLEELLAKIFGKQIRAKQDEIRGLAEANDGKDAAKNLEIQAKAFDLTNLVGTAAKIVSTVGETKNTALGRTS